MTTEEPHHDPIAEEAKRARQDSDGSLLPANDGLGPGAGETPSAAVESGSATGEPDAPETTSTPSLGAAPHRTERPTFRSSQLDGAPEERDAG